jgi:hypothetical protein
MIIVGCRKKGRPLFQLLSTAADLLTAAIAPDLNYYYSFSALIADFKIDRQRERERDLFVLY